MIISLNLSPEESVWDRNRYYRATNRERERGRESGTGAGNLNIPAGCVRGTPNPKNPSLFPLISEERHHNPIEGFANICSTKISTGGNREREEGEKRNMKDLDDRKRDWGKK